MSNRQEPAPSSLAGIPACWQRAEQEGAQGPHHACKKLLEASRSCYPHVPAACFQLPPASGCPPSSSHPDRPSGRAGAKQLGNGQIVEWHGHLSSGYAPEHTIATGSPILRALTCCSGDLKPFEEDLGFMQRPQGKLG